MNLKTIVLPSTGILLGGFLAAHWGAPHSVAISEQTRLALAKLGIHDFSGLAPREVFAWSALLTWKASQKLSNSRSPAGQGPCPEATLMCPWRPALTNSAPHERARRGAISIGI